MKLKMNETKMQVEDLKWQSVQPASISSFQFGNEPEVLHIIKSGFKDKYIVVFEDAYEISMGDILILNSEEIKEKFGIVIN